ncbi:MAG: transglutaminase domain-containing protein, partial [Candidatus Levybacteria bacterium]|nr:transglutaminase domain-containing protein [Candidatus Levybacteria bacterium]
MMRTIRIFFAVLFFFFLFFPKVYAADPQFDIAVDASYEVGKSGITSISQVISITNKTEFYYTPSYTVTVGFKDIENIQAYNADGTIPTTLDDKNNDSKSIKLAFPKRYAGISKTNIFTLKFTTKDIARQQGSVWEVTIPGIDKPNDFTSYTTTIFVPESFGKAAIIKPNVDVAVSEKIVLEKDKVGKAGVYILYGERQYYSFLLKYNISNPNLFPVTTEIALPPQTNYQNVIISDFSETPENVTKDIDGNWIAEYKLLPQQKKQIMVTGYVEIFSEPKTEELSSRQLREYTVPKKYWDSQDLQIKKSIEDLKTPKDIYEYVTKFLSYNYTKVATDNLRLGGKGALGDPKNSVCLEFSDLFVSLARAKGIPARSVEGFAYTQNSKLRPLSLVNDILHAWPEYYDSELKKWIMVDPTWGNTTKGMDYFTTLDFSHVTFVIKGIDSEYPIPAGGYKFNKESKDVEVKFATEKEFRQIKKIEITDSFPKFSFPKMAIQGSFT